MQVHGRARATRGTLREWIGLGRVGENGCKRVVFVLQGCGLQHFEKANTYERERVSVPRSSMLNARTQKKSSFDIEGVKFLEVAYEVSLAGDARLRAREAGV